MLRKLLFRDEDRVLVEQLRLVLGNVGMSLVPTIVLSCGLVWLLQTEANALAMMGWAAAVMVSKLVSTYHARRVLATGIASERVHALAGTLILLNAVDGIAWGSLPWVTLDHASVAGTVLVIAVMAGVTSNAMSVLAPVLPVFLAFCLCAVTAMAIKLSLMSDPEYQILAYITVLYIATHVAQGRVTANAAHAAISLRFENIHLIERLRTETERAQSAHKDAEHANLAKSKFLAAASHDLRQPMHAQGLFLEVIGRGELSSIQREMLNNALATSRAATGMLNTLLDFSRIEAGVVEPQLQAFALQTVLNKIEAELAPQAVAKGLVFRSRETQAVVYSDPMLVELVLRNLVTNAIRYTRDGGVLMACRANGNHVSVEIWDTGIGIEATQQQEIFREFHQLGNPERDRDKGLGLGLAIVDGLVRVLGHRLTLRSRSGRGSVFKLLLPSSCAPVQALPADHEPAAFLPLDMKVLIIDDDAAVRVGMVQLLREWGCTCVAVDSVEEALEAARTECPDMVISDYRLREQRSGTEAIALLRAQLRGDLPALLITGDTAPERLRQAQSSGIALLHKPVLPDHLYRKLVAARKLI
jgi:signal transduction histidine kinase/CheY-like chemotaxis protein